MDRKWNANGTLFKWNVNGAQMERKPLERTLNATKQLPIPRMLHDAIVSSPANISNNSRR